VLAGYARKMHVSMQCQLRTDAYL